MRKILLGLCLAGLSACAKEDTVTPSSGPTPTVATAAFEPTWTVAATQESIGFTNTSKNAVRYEWDFGDGRSSTAAAPTVIYPNPGTYTVRLLAYDASGKSSTFEQKIKVGKRYTKEVKVVGLRFTNPNGLPWDADGSGPDLRARYQFYKGLIMFRLVENVDPGKLPVTYSLMSYDLSIRELQPEIFDVALYDVDEPLSELMYEWKSPLPVPTRDAAGNGFFTLKGAAGQEGWNVQITFETL